jgi:SAM-dependent methyltransferase
MPAGIGKLATIVAAASSCPSGDIIWQLTPFRKSPLDGTVSPMNENHSALCSSPEWAELLTAEVLSPLSEGHDLGDRLLELGPGYGAATRWLRHRVTRLVALELDAPMGQRLADEFSGTNVTVEIGDCTRAPFPDASFDSVATFTMLHHLPTAALQYAALAEAFRVLCPGGVLVGSDSLASPELHQFHEGDTYNPIDPARLLVFLQAIGYARICLTVDRGMTFAARKPELENADD